MEMHNAHVLHKGKGLPGFSSNFLFFFFSSSCPASCACDFFHNLVLLSMKLLAASLLIACATAQSIVSKIPVVVCTEAF